MGSISDARNKYMPDITTDVKVSNVHARENRWTKQIINLKKLVSNYFLEIPFREFRGKICRHSQIIFKKVNGTRYTSVVCNPHKGAPTEAQQEQRNKMRTAVANIKKLNSTELAAYRQAFKAQSKYKTLRGYMIAQEMLKL